MTTYIGITFDTNKSLFKTTYRDVEEIYTCGYENAPSNIYCPQCGKKLKVVMRASETTSLYPGFLCSVTYEYKDIRYKIRSYTSYESGTPINYYLIHLLEINGDNNTPDKCIFGLQLAKEVAEVLKGYGLDAVPKIYTIQLNCD